MEVITTVNTSMHDLYINYYFHMFRNNHVRDGTPGKVYVKYTCSDVRYRHEVSVACEFNTLWHSDKVP